MSADGDDELVSRSESYRLALTPSLPTAAQGTAPNRSPPQVQSTSIGSTSKEALLSEPLGESNHDIDTPIFDQTSFYDRFTFRYVLPLLRLGASRIIGMDDIPKVATHDETRTICARIRTAWQHELERDPTRSKGTPSVPRAIWRAFRREFLWAGYYAAGESATFLIQPLLIRFFVQWLEDKGASSGLGWGLVVCLVVAGLSQAIVHHLLYFETMRLGWNLRIGFTAFLHEHMLTLPTAVVNTFGTGRVVNLISTDVLRFDIATMAVHFAWTTPLEVLVASSLIVNTVGWAAGMAGVGVVLLSMVILLFFGKRFAARRKKTAAYTDQRVTSTQEVLNGMLTVKAYCWEQAFTDSIGGVRAQEASSILKAQRLKAVNSTMYFATPILASLVTFSVYSSLGNTFNVPQVLFVVSMLQVLRLAVGKKFTRLMESMPEAWVAMKRIEAFLLVDVHSSVALPPTQGSSSTTSDTEQLLPLIALKNVTIQHPLAPFKLANVNFQLYPKDLVGIGGRVMAGKTTLLEALLGEVPVHGSMTKARSAIAYAGQTPWIFAGSLRANIVFDTPFDEGRYRQVVRACALEADIEQLPDGEDTDIGEKGVNLSGGQKARVALARACYSSAPMVLLDDPLSAVDHAVADILFQQAICGVLKDRCVVLVTHHPHFIARCHRALEVVDGTVIERNPTVFATHESSLGKVPAVVKASTKEGVDESTDGEKDEPEAGRRGSKMVLAEDRQRGKVHGDTYWTYFRAGGLALVLPVLLGFLVAQGGLMTSDYWLQRWASQSPRNQDDDTNLHVFLGLTLGTASLALFNSIMFFTATNRANSSIHHRALARVLRAPMHFFTSNPLGRILNRFSADLGQVDELLPARAFDTLMLASQTVGALVVVCLALPWLCIGLPLLFWYLVHIRTFVTKSLRELKRLEGVSRSPVYAMFSADLAGLTYIRSFDAAKGTQSRFHDKLEITAAAWFWWLIGNRYLGFRLDLLATSVVAVTAIVGVILKDTTDSGLLGLGLVYAMSLSGLFQFMVRMSALVETYMTSVERILHYANNLDSEDDEDTTVKVIPNTPWPDKAAIATKDLHVRYRSDLPNVLHGLTLQLPAGKIVGIVGRTGSGKSSFLQALLRLNTISQGHIEIDGVDTKTIPLQLLRQAVSMIPQMPDLFAGTVRYNLDPTNTHTDADMRKALQAAQLSTMQLTDEIAMQGSNMSTGQRQLVSLARAILHHRKIVVLDEASANTDYATDALIQETLRTSPAFQDSTILVIAHRLKTVEDADWILKLDHGEVVAQGTPAEVL